MENRYYGTGDIIESATGYLVKVGEPVFDDKVTADEYGVVSILVGGNYAIKNDTQYLVTLEVNGESKMYRELWMSGNADTANEVALSDYTFTMDEGYIRGLTEDDVVIARFEPVEVYTTDAFRAAVGKVAPKSEGGSGGGGVLEVTVDWDTADGTLDKTWQEIADAPMAIFKNEEYTYFRLFAKQMGEQYGVIFANVNRNSMTWDSPYIFVASSASGYPTYTDGE